MDPRPGGRDETADRRSSEGRRLEALVRERWHGPGGIRGLAEHLGLTRATIYLWFRGVTRPNASTLALLAKVIDVTPDELLSIFDVDAAAANEVDANYGQSSELSIGFLRRESRSKSSPKTPRQLGLFGTLTVGAALGARGALWCEADEPVGAVARLLYTNDFSQVPVRDNGAWIGLLTAETITRWLAARSSRTLAYDEQTPVREVLPYAEDPKSFRIAAAGLPLDALISLFDRAAARGRPLMAVLVTETGQARGDLLAIVTPFDLPRLRRAAR